MEALYLLSYAGVKPQPPNKATAADTGCGGRIRTDNLRVMSPTSYRCSTPRRLVEGAGFEPAKAAPADLQSAPFGHSGTPPRIHLSTCRFRQQHHLFYHQESGQSRATWSWGWDSNPQPEVYKTPALPLSYPSPAPCSTARCCATRLIVPRPPRSVQRQPHQRFSLSRFSRYRSSLRLTRWRALSMDLTWRLSSSAISW